MKLDMRCQYCGAEAESINHVLFTCPIARQMCALSGFPCSKDGFDGESLFSNFHYLFTMENLKSIPREIRGSFPWILWLFWKNRNKFYFEGNFFFGYGHHCEDKRRNGTMEFGSIFGNDL